MIENNAKTHKTNKNLGVPVILYSLEVLEQWAQAHLVWKKIKFLNTGKYLMIGMAGLLQGHEILLADLH